MIRTARGQSERGGARVRARPVPRRRQATSLFSRADQTSVISRVWASVQDCEQSAEAWGVVAGRPGLVARPKCRGELRSASRCLAGGWTLRLAKASQQKALAFVSKRGGRKHWRGVAGVQPQKIAPAISRLKVANERTSVHFVKRTSAAIFMRYPGCQRSPPTRKASPGEPGTRCSAGEGGPSISSELSRCAPPASSAVGSRRRPSPIMIRRTVAIGTPSASARCNHCASIATRANGLRARAAIAATSATTASRSIRSIRSTLERLRRSAYRRPISKTKRVTPTTVNTGPTVLQTLVMIGSWNTCLTNSDMAVMKMPFMTQSVADHCVSQIRH